MNPATIMFSCDRGALQAERERWETEAECAWRLALERIWLATPKTRRFQLPAGSLTLWPFASPETF